MEGDELASNHDRLPDSRIEEMKRLLQRSMASAEPSPHVSPEEVLKLVHEVQESRSILGPVNSMLGDDAASVLLCAPSQEGISSVFVVNKQTGWGEQRVTGSSLAEALSVACGRFGR